MDKGLDRRSSNHRFQNEPDDGVNLLLDERVPHGLDKVNNGRQNESVFLDQDKRMPTGTITPRFLPTKGTVDLVLCMGGGGLGGDEEGRRAGKLRGYHENVKVRIKSFGCTKNRWRHPLQRHNFCFFAVYKIVNLMIVRTVQ